MSLRMEWEPSRHRKVPNDSHGSLREDRVGVMLHYDGSGTDEGAVSWFADPRCRVSYHLLVLDDGSYVRVAPDDRRAWHAGYCRTSDPERLPYEDANSALYGISAATNGSTRATTLQILATAWLVRRWFFIHNWDPEDTWRIVGHHTEAVYGPDHPRAGQRGRKTDPVGADPENPIMGVDEVRGIVRRLSAPLSSPNLG